jgi:hypothetical protein
VGSTQMVRSSSSSTSSTCSRPTLPSSISSGPRAVWRQAAVTCLGQQQQAAVTATRQPWPAQVRGSAHYVIVLRAINF